MTGISGAGGCSAASVYQTQQAQQNTQQQKTAQSQPKQDSVQLSAAARAALGGGDADHDGDSQ